MTTQVNRHFNEAQLLRAVVDETDLTAADRAHLETCRPCRKMLEQLTGELAVIGRRAGKYSPGPQRQVVLPAGKSTRRTWNWRYGLVPTAVAALALILVFVWTGPEKVTVDGPGPTVSALEEDSDPEDETQVLSDNALPDVFMDIIGDEETEFSDEFMEFVVPDPDSDDESISGKRKEVYHA